MLNVTSKKRILLSSPHMSGNEEKYINEAFETNWIAPLGPNLDAFEKDIAKYVGVKEVLAVSSGTAAIHLALSLLGVRKDDTVFCSSLTFVATANPILYLNAQPIFIDSEPETWNMSPIALERALREAANAGKLPKAVIIVNLYGQPAKMAELVTICNQYEVPIIEDAAESLGATYKGKASGTFGKFGIYSFNGNKIITTSGGGAVISNDTNAIQRARFLATQAKDVAPHYQHSEVGYNYRMSNILAGIGRGQLEVLGERVKARRAVYDLYYQHLADLPGLKFMPELENTCSNRWLTALTINEAEFGISIKKLLQALQEDNIEARHVWKPLHMQPIFKGYVYYPHYRETNVSEQLFFTGICLPSGSNMTRDDQMRVINSIKNAINKGIDNTHSSKGNPVGNG
ncbi:MULTISPECIES: DegT/DnrJ/EryC1/StrS family aminotransferase [Peribacillus]|uniref:DegT/DnrJ/EryC1/StrS family aminotransferase n=1 Tax=Peribacillus TaxID=2675229 RepID=UPI001F4D839C|nr:MULTISPECIES: aminotransferase class I/II-fold pyridoxal phosphate-dependent enzyme [unclassified Peribacillus]MCK1983014.1 aminotransferase class I/II-fold pyridoxal phosphate-dependent enzyme [Peribacillus sp. Aquil_B1]MCK2011104.1 aminotransferase class I/II-fold pyridoxal phosphate-dependent enzyme [Peribacillus sp. Aquil_B8]